MLDRRMVLFEDVDKALAHVRKADGVGCGVFGKMWAEAAGVAGVAEFALLFFSGSVHFTGVAFTFPSIVEREARGRVPGAGSEGAEREEVGAGHGQFRKCRLADSACDPKSYENMATSRIGLLEQLLQQDPSSTFARYGLAMEYVNAGDFARAIPEFEKVLTVDPKYAAAYFHGGQTLEKMGEIEKARAFYKRGLAATTDAHARSEMQAALDILGD